MVGGSRLREGYLDIETDSKGRGAGNFGIIYSWAIKERGSRKVEYGVLSERSLDAEKKMIQDLIDTLSRYDKIYTYYGTVHDIPIMRTRALYHGLEFPPYMAVIHDDLYYKVKRLFNFHSNRLDVVADFFGVNSKTKLKPEVWVAAKFGDQKALEYIVKHNIEDVKTLERVHEKIRMYYLGTNRSI